MFNKEQKEFICSLGFDVDFDNLTDDECIAIEDAVSDKLLYDGLDKDYRPTVSGEMCLAILDKLADG